VYAEGFIRSPTNINADGSASCSCQLNGDANEIIQFYVEDFDLAYPVDDPLGTRQHE
jgi:hypothetical protein